jgi:hypothetical protein
MIRKEFIVEVNGNHTIVSAPEYGPNEIREPVQHPVHYNKGIECWDYIISHNMGFLEGNIVKYVTRYKTKNGREDLLKAREYLDKLLEQVE